MRKDSPKLKIHLDLLHPQSNPEKLPVKFVRWLLSSGRYVLIFVEAIVLLAFISRFKLDTDLSERKDAIEQQIPYLESLKPYEILIRQTQLKLSTIGNIKSTTANYSLILKKIADQTPPGVKLISLNLVKDAGRVTIQINATSQSNNDLTSFVAGLKEDQIFSDVSVASVSLEEGLINFTLSARSKLDSEGGRNL